MSWRRHLLLFVVLVPLFNTLAVLTLPHAVNAYVMHRIVDQALAEAAVASDDPAIQTRKALILERGGINVALPATRANAGSRTVVRPSPDLLYTACVFDLEQGPLHVTAPIPDSYLSVAGFAADTSNFFAVNDRDIAADTDAPRWLDLRISHDPADASKVSSPTIRAPTSRGLVLFRTLVQNQASDPFLMELRNGQNCTPLPQLNR